MREVTKEKWNPVRVKRLVGGGGGLSNEKEKSTNVSAVPPSPQMRAGDGVQLENRSRRGEYELLAIRSAASNGV